MKSRKERRAEAKENKLTFEPQYKGRVVSKEQYDKEVQELKEEREKQESKFKSTK